MAKRRQIPNPTPTGVGRRLDKQPVRYMRSRDEGFIIRQPSKEKPNG